MTPAALRKHCLSLDGAQHTYPFGPETSVFKTYRGKIFAITRLDGDPLTVSVKVEPELGEGLRGAHESIVPGYHLNKKHWITITLGGDAPDALVKSLIEDSFDLVMPKAWRDNRQDR